MMKNKFIMFIKKWYQLFIILAIAIVGTVLMFYGGAKSVPYMNLERDYQIKTFGFYDSSLKYLLDVDNSLHYFNAYIILGISLLFGDLIYALFTMLDMYYSRKKKIEVHNE